MTIDDAKAQAKALRAALQAQGTAISHALSLEMIAKQHGARDWNTSTPGWHGAMRLQTWP